MTECNITSYPEHHTERQCGHTPKNRDCNTWRLSYAVPRCARTPRRTRPIWPAARRRSAGPAGSPRAAAWWQTPGSSGIPAERRRGKVTAPRRSGVCTVEVRPRLPVRGDIRRRTRWSRSFPPCPVIPACCGATHAVASPCLSWAVSWIAIPGPIRSPSRSGSPAAASAGSSRRRSFQSHWYEPSRRLHPALSLMTSRIPPATSSSPSPPATTPSRNQTPGRAAPLRHHPPRTP